MTNVDQIADKHLKPYGLSLPEDDELRLVAKLVDDTVKQRMGVLGTNKVPTPLGAADMQALGEVMSKAAEAAVNTHMAEITHKLDVLASQMAFITNMVCQKTAAEPSKPKSRWRFWW